MRSSANHFTIHYHSGYMAPEYMMHGQFSVKAWKSWMNGTISDIIDPTLKAKSGSMHNIIRHIHIALLCVQENAIDRPTMALVVLMLNSFSVTLPIPTEPAFFMHSVIDAEMPLLLEYRQGATG
ncbi:putative non-specific serine/threonine protein kinase [Helianthus annuus]|nr:putative non-specific serine/threonine protein kinase [Helianthus annuus]KAJ0448416.1 putative non-specific serine/threonine protein kinase [Helianthus annuus]KAJ0633303.1 putative non-specific serine/threonine protein kinase [Helianthus annuus]